MANIRKGDRIIAKTTSARFGHVKGDTLIVQDFTPSAVTAKNLTRPGIRPLSTLLPNEYKNISQEERAKETKAASDKHRVYFLGIPLFTTRKVDDNAGK